MFNKLIKHIKSLHKYKNRYDRCYIKMKSSGHAISKMCGGQLGGSAATDYLAESCIGCPYLCLWRDKE